MVIMLNHVKPYQNLANHHFTESKLNVGTVFESLARIDLFAGCLQNHPTYYCKWLYNSQVNPQFERMFHIVKYTYYAYDFILYIYVYIIKYYIHIDMYCHEYHITRVVTVVTISLQALSRKKKKDKQHGDPMVAAPGAAPASVPATEHTGLPRHLDAHWDRWTWSGLGLGKGWRHYRHL